MNGMKKRLGLMAVCAITGLGFSGVSLAGTDLGSAMIHDFGGTAQMLSVEGAPAEALFSFLQVPAREYSIDGWNVRQKEGRNIVCYEFARRNETYKKCQTIIYPDGHGQAR